MAFIDQGESEAMKTPVVCRAPRCDKDQFRAKMTVSTSTVCQISLLNRASRIFYFRWEEREREKNTSGHSSQLPVPRRNVIIAAGHAHGMQIKTFYYYYYYYYYYHFTVQMGAWNGLQLS